MKKLNLIILTLLFAIPGLHAQVVINEIAPEGGLVELKNLGSSDVDVSGYWLCNFPNYSQLSSLSVQCGDLNLSQDEILVVSGFNSLNFTDGELGLYNAGTFESSDAILDYVEWGSSGHMRSSVAQAKGIWSSGQFVPGFAGSESLEYDGSGDGPDNWTAAAQHSLCAENGTVSGISDLPDQSLLSIYPNPVASVLQIEINATQGAAVRDLAVIDASGRTLRSYRLGSASSYLEYPVNELSRGVYFIRLTGPEKVIYKKFLVN